jgi:DNA-binding transcriptional MerR regulator
MLNDCFDVSEICERYNVKPETVRVWCRKKQIPYFKRGRFYFFPKKLILEQDKNNIIMPEHVQN